MASATAAPSGKDLPMSANVSEIAVKHFVLDLVCKIEQHVFEGSIILFCCPAQQKRSVFNHSSCTRDEGGTTLADHSACTLADDRLTGVNSKHTGRTQDAELTQDSMHRVNGYSSTSNVTAETDTVQDFSQHCLKDDHLTGSKSVSPGEHDAFMMVLDCYKLDIQKVEGIFLCEEWRKLLQVENELFTKQLTEGDISLSLIQQHTQEMSFTVEEHCVRVFMDGVQRVEDFPNAMQIWYSTKPDGPSLKWTTNQDGNQCVFTIGHFLSNRSLFPSQDVPTALLTWQATVTVAPRHTVLMAGDFEPTVTSVEGNQKFSYCTTFPMPSCTFAIAVGSWKCERLIYPVQEASEGISVPLIRLICPDCLRERATSLLSWYLPSCFLEVQKMLGVYPFFRLDVLIVPACFDSLGMASPSILFLSQSVLCPDGSMCVRVAHELCHTWFGLVTGPLDWTEEWLTEGFCTYFEDMLHARVCQMGEDTEDYVQLRKELNLHILRAELENTDQDLQSLRPNHGKPCESYDGEPRFLKNGMNPEKKFMQVHYLKGYFLLHALEDAVGHDRFLAFLKDYVQTYIYQLVTSQDFLQMFFRYFTSELKDKTLTQEGVDAEWLDCPGMPQPLEASPIGSIQLESVNTLVQQVSEQAHTIMDTCRKLKRRRGGKGSLAAELPKLEKMTPAQVMLLFDHLLEEDRLPGHILDLLKDTHSTHFINAEVSHRWCELVIKHKRRMFYPDVKEFLVEHQGMGIYLYGEAMIYRCPEMRKLARTCFRQLRHDMPDAVVETISAMLFPQ